MLRSPRRPPHSASAQGQSLRAVLPRIAKLYNANISYPPDARGSVNVSLSDATLEQALSAVLFLLGFRYRRDNGVIVVFRAANPVNGAAEPSPSVIPVTLSSVDRAVAIVRTLYPTVSVPINTRTRLRLRSSTPRSGRRRSSTARTTLSPRSRPPMSLT